MAFQKISQSGHISYGRVEFVMDTDADAINLPLDVAMGSTALSIESGTVYMKNSKGWQEVGGNKVGAN